MTEHLCIGVLHDLTKIGPLLNLQFITSNVIRPLVARVSGKANFMYWMKIPHGSVVISSNNS